MQLDYSLTNRLEEWVGGTYRITDDFCRLKIFTEKAQKALWHTYGKMVPLFAVIKLTPDEFDELKNMFWKSKELSGLYGPYRVKSFTLDTFMHRENDAEATEEELSYEFSWEDL